MRARLESTVVTQNSTLETIHCLHTI